MVYPSITEDKSELLYGNDIIKNYDFGGISLGETFLYQFVL